ncbi:hypothetical protein [Thiothrix nivea]|uniref:Uncharacterized protein n=1 Tax=Thiothrix nivea (strain ATCC 35100 / DSM 5205 / JP2) TaxID=870187 RepID=A0A656HEH1_THINJ|nr:hypothetical protein [Thiothrix nivea]EIJ34592.1 hypothetical protein Thini_2018 [Thiothrix nivea DSM 5205]
MKLYSAFFYPRAKQYLLLTGSIALLAASTSTAATTVTLVATIKEQPVLAPASWTVFSIKDKEQKSPIATLPRHSGTVNLPNGFYCAKVQMQHKSGEAEFWVESGVDKVVSIPLD